MLYVRCEGLAKDVAYPLKPPFLKVTSRKSKEMWIKGPEWNNADYLSHPAQGTTNSHPHSNQRKRMWTWEKKEINTGNKKSKQRKKNRRKVKRKETS